jgi:outer membrane protein assembly factor BamB
MAKASTQILSRTAMGLSLVLALGACDREIILEGERFGTRVPLEASLPGEDGTIVALAATEDVARAISLPAASRLEAWPQRGLNAQNRIGHVVLSPAPTEIFAVNIGQGNSRQTRITADPVAGGGRIFTLDSDAGLVATGMGGETLWATNLLPAFERGGGVSGGALALDGDMLFATTGYRELVALDASTGAVIWRQQLDAGITAPTVVGDTVYVVSRDSQAWSIDRSDGRIRWQLPASPVGAVLSGGGAAPAITDRFVIFPFGSGEIVGSMRQSGTEIWRSNVVGGRRGVAYNDLNDITSDPVVVGNTIYVGNQSGRVVALNATTGARIWTASEGAYSPVVPAGGSLFFVSDRNELIRIDADTGERIWGTELPLYQQDRERRRRSVFTHYGPILAGGQLVVASGDGLIRFFSPESGALTGTAEIRGGAAAHPIVVNDTLFVMSQDGRLHAYR